jgi:hypothetical protein
MQQNLPWIDSSSCLGTPYQSGSYSYAREGYSPDGIAKMLWFIRQYDESFERLAQQGGSTQDIRTLTHMLQHEFVICGPYGESEAKLSDPASVSRALSNSGQYDVHFEVRRTDLGLPAYYVCRIRQDYWGAYGLVVEDLFRSKRYIIDEPRFVKLFAHGRNTHFLRLSDFREDVARMLGEAGATERPRTDSLIYLLGRYVLQGAWHVDQRFSFLVAAAFDLPGLKQVVELSYMCLSCDLCALRRYLNDDILRFFEDIYSNRALASLIARLPSLTGNHFNALSKKALDCYVEVTLLFNSFLKTEVVWQAVERETMPLWKLILGNMDRLSLVAQQAGGQQALQKARQTLETESEECVGKLLQIA